MESYKDKVIVITGGATGIGFGFAKAMGIEGANIILAGRRESRLQEAVENLAKFHIDCTYKVCDVTDYSGVEALADFAWAWKGRVDVVINNAGIVVPHATVLDMPVEDVHKIFNINLFGLINGSKVFGKRFIELGTPAAIYNIGSENSFFHGTPLNGAYVATKHSALAITQSLYEELPDFIDVSLICPGFVVSELGPEENMKHGMPTEQFVEVAMKQLKAGEFFIVSHSYNVERINERHNMIIKAYDNYAPRYEGDQQYDVRTVIAPILEDQIGIKLRKLI